MVQGLKNPRFEMKGLVFLTSAQKTIYGTCKERKEGPRLDGTPALAQKQVLGFGKPQ